MTPEESKAYQQGYRAGRQTAKERRTIELIQQEKQAVLDRIYLALLPVAIQVEIDRGGAKITTVEERIKAAAEWSEIAYKRRPTA